MLEFIPPSLAGLEIPAVPSADPPPAVAPQGAPFDQEMDRALAASQPGMPVGKAPASRPAPPQDSPAGPAAADSQKPAEPALPEGEASRSKPRPRSRERHEDTPTGDGNLVQAMAAMSLVSAALPKASNDLKATAGRASTRGQPVLDAAPAERPPIAGPLAAAESASPLKAKPPVDQLSSVLPTQGSPAADAPPVNSRASVPAAATPALPDKALVTLDGKAANELQPAPVSREGPAPPRSPQPPGTGLGLPAGTGSGSTSPGADPVSGLGKDYPSGLGTPVAQQEMPMKKAEKTQRNAGSSQQNLPGESAVNAGHAGVRTALVSAASSTGDMAALSNAGPINGSAAAETALPGGVAAEARLSSLERTHDLVALHALRLSQSGNDSLRVVLEPGGGTRLSLELRFGAGGIEAQALLHRGDFQFLNTHWAELQQRLEPRGVHLAALECATDASGGNGQFPQSRQESPEEAPTRSAFAEFALNGPMSDLPAPRRARTKTHAGWESWA